MMLWIPFYHSRTKLKSPFLKKVNEWKESLFSETGSIKSSPTDMPLVMILPCKSLPIAKEASPGSLQNAREDNCINQFPFSFSLVPLWAHLFWACVTTQPSSLHAVREQKGFFTLTSQRGHAEDCKRTLPAPAPSPQGRQGGTGQRVGPQRRERWVYSGSASATLPHVPTPGRSPGPRGGGCRHRPPGAPHLLPGEGVRPSALPGGGVSGCEGSRARVKVGRGARGVGPWASTGSPPAAPSRLPPQIPSFSWDLFRFST